MKPDCLFCGLPTLNDRPILAENDLAYAVADKYPVAEGHVLVVVRRHVADYFDLTHQELKMVNCLLSEQRNLLLANDPSINGFNVGVNSGEAAGQTQFHCHVHLIPRRQGDVENPRGGVRHVIPGKGNY
jgi:ATP adenylyltransferase